MHTRFLLISLLSTILSFSFFTTSSFAAGNPYLASHGINFASGNKYHSETDISIAGSVSPFSFTRHYNSQSTVNGELGYGWSHSFAEKISVVPGSKIKHTRSDGRVVTYLFDSGTTYIKENGKLATITEEVSGDYALTRNGFVSRVFDSNGKLKEISDRRGNITSFLQSGNDVIISDNFGRELTLTYDANGIIESLSTPVGKIRYYYDTAGNLEQVTRPDSTTVLKQYHYTDHNLTGITDEVGRDLLTVGYNADDKVTSASLQGGLHLITIDYRPYPDNHKRIITDNGEDTTYELTYNFGIAQVKSVTGTGCSSCGLESGASYEYNDKLQVNKITDVNNIVTSYGFDANGNREYVIEDNDNTELKRITYYDYHLDTNLLWKIRKESLYNTGNETSVEWIYDNNNNYVPDEKIESGYEIDGSTIDRTTDYTYDEFGRIEWIDGARELPDLDNDTVTFDYYDDVPDEDTNRYRMLKTITNGAGHVTQFTIYNGLRKPTTIIDPNGIETVLVYNSFGKLSSRTINDTRSTIYEYDDSGVLETVNLPDGRTLDYTYRLNTTKIETITDAQGNYIWFDYDSVGNLKDREINDSTDTLTAAIHYSYNSHQRLHTTWNNEGTSDTDPAEELLYDLVGNLEYSHILHDNGTTSTTLTTQYEYDNLRRLTGIINPGSTEVNTAFDYDSHDNQIKVTDDNGIETIYEFDDFGRRVERDSDDTKITTYIYDKSDNLKEKKDANNKTLIYEYDGLNRLLSVSSNSVVLKSYTYDEDVDSTTQKGYLTSMIDGSGSSAYKYNSYGELIRETRTTSGIPFTLEYGYNNNGELETITYPSGREITYNRNDTGQLSSIYSKHNEIDGSLTPDIKSKPFGPITDINLGNGQSIVNTYDTLYRLNSSTVDGTYQRTYAYWTNNQVDSISDGIDSGYDQTFTYDLLGQLDIATGFYGTIDFDHDKVGNRTYKTHGADTTDYQPVLDTNKLYSVETDSFTYYTHDNAGNVTTIDAPGVDNDLDYIWTDDNRLDEVKKNNLAVENYLYDGEGRRTVKDVENGDKTLYVYAPNGNLLVEADNQGNIDREYVYLNGRSFVHFGYNNVQAQSAALPVQADESVRVYAPVVEETTSSSPQQESFAPTPFSLTTTSLTSSQIAASLVPVYHILLFGKKTQPAEGAYYYINDHMGTPQIITDDAGSVVWKGHYYPFGDVSVDPSSTIVNNLRFPGQYFDSGTGLYSNWNRYYDFGTGRYPSADPIGLSGGINLYAYVGADPVNFIDPEGLHGIILAGKTPFIYRAPWLRGGRIPRSGDLNKPIPRTPKPEGSEWMGNPKPGPTEWSKSSDSPFWDFIGRLLELGQDFGSWILTPPCLEDHTQA